MKIERGNLGVCTQEESCAREHAQEKQPGEDSLHVCTSLVLFSSSALAALMQASCKREYFRPGRVAGSFAYRFVWSMYAVRGIANRGKSLKMHR